MRKKYLIFQSIFVLFSGLFYFKTLNFKKGFDLCFDGKNGFCEEATSMIEKVIIEDFEEGTKGRVKVSTERGCNLELTSKEFVISGKNALKFNVSNQNIDSIRPPYFLITPSLTDWRDFGTLSFYILILPNTISLQAGMLIQLHSTDWDGKTWLPGDTLWNFRFNVPCGKPFIVKIPVDKIKFKDKVGEILFCATSTSGTYLIDKMELSTERINDVELEEFLPSEGVFIPEWTFVSLIQEGSFYHLGNFCYYSDRPLYLSLELPKPAEKKEEKLIKLFDEKGNKLLEKNVIFEKGESKKEIPLSLEKISYCKININDKEITMKIRDIKGTREENIKIRQKRRETGNPFYRGIISLYAGMIYKQDGFPDIDATIERIKDLGANCYTYLIYTKSEKELSALPEFCEKAAKEGIEVWVYIVPPSEAPIGRDKPISERKYPPYDMDYLKWAEKISEISLNHPNLTLWMIDDFDANLNFFTLDYTKKIYEKTKEINPKLLFGVCVYYDSIRNFVEKGYLPYFDAVLWGYQHSSVKYPDCGLNPESLSVEINDYYKLCPGKILIPCIYFTPHSSWPKERPTRKYLEKAIEIAYNEAGICWVYTMPAPGTMKYEVVKNFIGKIKLRKL